MQHIAALLAPGCMGLFFKHSSILCIAYRPTIEISVPQALDLFRSGFLDCRPTRLPWSQRSCLFRVWLRQGLSRLSITVHISETVPTVAHCGCGYPLTSNQKTRYTLKASHPVSKIALEYLTRLALYGHRTICTCQATCNGR
jgi:hypothetical protein